MNEIDVEYGTLVARMKVLGPGWHSVFDDDIAAAPGVYGSSSGLDRVQGVSQILDGPFSLSEAVLT